MPTIRHASSQHCRQVGQSHSISPSAPRGWETPHRHRIGSSRGTFAVPPINGMPLTSKREPAKRVRCRIVRREQIRHQQHPLWQFGANDYGELLCADEKAVSPKASNPSLQQPNPPRELPYLTGVRRLGPIHEGGHHTAYIPLVAEILWPELLSHLQVHEYGSVIVPAVTAPGQVVQMRDLSLRGCDLGKIHVISRRKASAISPASNSIFTT